MALLAAATAASSRAPISHSADTNGLLKAAGFTNTFSDKEIRILSEWVRVVTHDEALPVMEKDERGAWFGFILTGALAVVVTDAEIILEPGDLVGEIAVWDPDSRRVATVVSRKPGMLASMLIEVRARHVENRKAPAHIH